MYIVFFCSVDCSNTAGHFLLWQAPFNDLIFTMASTDTTIGNYFGVYSDGSVFTRKTFVDLPSPNVFTVSFCFCFAPLHYSWEWYMYACNFSPLPVSLFFTETIEVIIIKLGMVTASDMVIHPVLIILTLTSFKVTQMLIMKIINVRLFQKLYKESPSGSLWRLFD